MPEKMLEKILAPVAILICSSVYAFELIDGWTLMYCGIILGASIIKD